MRLRPFAVVSSFGLAGWLTMADLPRAHACGCFTPPDPTVPIVQAGEQIAFEYQNGQVTAHIKVAYSGPAEEFGWLLPLPAEPAMELGTDELFSQLIATTQPKYRLDREYHGICPFDPNDPNRFAGGGAAPTSDSAEDQDGNIVVVQDSIGPYDYAVLRADSEQPMLDWLAANRYFVPTSTAEAVTPYIHEGAFFLALKLRKGNDIGDLQPVVVRYASDLPMIPIVLTSVGASENMPLLVWMVGAGRAIPRNYYHTLVNDASVDWLNAGANYLDVINRAVDEAPDHHSFVTEYAGTSDIMKNVIDYPGRFGVKGELAALTQPQPFMDYLNYHGFAVPGSAGPPNFTQQLSPQLLAVLARHLPVPARVLEQGITASDYYFGIQYWSNWYATTYPTQTDLDLAYDPVVVADEIWERVVTPTLQAGQMFQRNPKLTRLFTTLSPTEMTRDPVFSFNPELPDVPTVRTGKLQFKCGFTGVDNQDINKVPAVLITPSGWSLAFPKGIAENPWLDVSMPASWKTQTLREEGQPELVSDNTDEILSAIHGTGNADGGGCAVALGRGRQLGALALLGVALVLGVVVRRRR
jgi:hypothetical protein